MVVFLFDVSNRRHPVGIVTVFGRSFMNFNITKGGPKKREGDLFVIKRNNTTFAPLFEENSMSINYLTKN